MKRIKYILVLIILGQFYSSAQTQQGFVKTRGKMNTEGELVPGERISGVTLVFNTNATHISDKNGDFSFHVPSKTFSLVTASKQGYSLVDADALMRQNSYSARDPFVVVMEDEAQHRQDVKDAADKVRRTLKREIRRREDELDAMREENAITQGRYDSLRLEFARYRQSSEALVNEMAERFASIDYDRLDEFNRQVQMYIETGELVKADSLINTKGSIEERYNRVKEQIDINVEREKELHRQQKKLALSKQLTEKEKEDLKNDLYTKHTIFLQHYQQDSALYCLKMRADLDLTSFESLFDYVSLSMNQKKYSVAEEYLKIMHSQKLSKHELAWVQNAFGLLYLNIGDFSESKKYYCLALENRIDLSSVNTFDSKKELAIVYHNLCGLSRKTSDYENGEKYGLEALRIVDELYKADHVAYGLYEYTILIELCNLYLGMSKYAESERCGLDALSVVTELFAADQDKYRADLANIQNSLGNLYCGKRRYAESERYYLASLENTSILFRENPDVYESEIARLYGNLGSCYRYLRKFDLSRKYYLMSLERRQSIFNQYGSIRNQSFLAGAEVNLALLYYNVADYSKSEELLLKGLSEYELLYKHDSRAYGLDLARTQNVLSLLYKKTKAYDKAEHYLFCALEVVNDLFESAPEIYREDLSDIQNNIGILYTTTKNYSKAEQYLLSVLKNSEILFKENPDVNEKNLADALLNLGDLYDTMNEFDKCSVMYSRAISHYERLYEIDSEQYGSGLADIHQNVAIHYFRTNDFVECEKNAKKALAVKEAFASDNPGSMASTLSLLGMIYDVTKDYENCKRYIIRAIEVYEGLYEKNPQIYHGRIYGCYDIMARACVTTEDYDKSLYYLDKILTINDKSVFHYHLRGIVLLKKGDLHGAKEMWMKVIELNPEYLKENSGKSELYTGLKELENI